jgi:hypothetical protein
MLFGGLMFLGNKYKEFWLWFKNKSDDIFNFESNTDKILDKLHHELHKINENLTFEFGPIINNKRIFIISADGIKEAFNDVETLFVNKPLLDKWEIIKFRQRGDINNYITMGNITVYPENIRYLIFPHDKKIGLMLFIKDYNINPEINKQIGYIFLDNALGEYDVEIKIGGIKFCDYNTEYFEQSSSIETLREEFDKLCKNFLQEEI